MRENGHKYGVLVENPVEGDHFGRPGLNVGIILKW
jgi:hypothetical protein